MRCEGIKVALTDYEMAEQRSSSASAMGGS